MLELLQLLAGVLVITIGCHVVELPRWVALAASAGFGLAYSRWRRGRSER